MLKISYRFQFNGWKLVMNLEIEPQKILKDIIEVKMSITGHDFDDKHGILDIKTGVLLCENELMIKSYTDDKPSNITRKFSVPVAKILQIKTYLS